MSGEVFQVTEAHIDQYRGLEVEDVGLWVFRIGPHFAGFRRTKAMAERTRGDLQTIERIGSYFRGRGVRE